MEIGDKVVEKLAGTPRMTVMLVDGDTITVKYISAITGLPVVRAMPAELLTLVPQRR